MALAIVYSRASLGMHAPLVTVEAHIAYGMPKLSIVGLPETAVKESKDRVRSALLNMHFEFPPDRITINLAPADLPKEGGRFDLPIALSILAASQQLPQTTLDQYEFVGELGLGGEIRPIKGILPLALQTKKQNRALILPYKNADEAAIVEGLTVLPAHHILDVCEHVTQQKMISPYRLSPPLSPEKDEHDLSDIRGQYQARRALEIAAAGGHNLLFIGPPGTGKTMLAHRLPTLLPSMTENEALETAMVSSISHRGFHLHEWKKRPFRTPHHSASSVALVGGGNPPKPGEISLSHHGVLFLDELPEFNRHVLEALREPLEAGRITISRAAQQCEFPADFQLIAAMNPCPCGYLGDPDHSCRCTEEQIKRYRTKISGPLLDRIDMHIEVPRFPFHQWLTQDQKTGESSSTVRARVEWAAKRQFDRTHKLNAKLTEREINHYISLDDSQKQFLATAMDQLKLSLRRYNRILKVARTIADLDQKDQITLDHLKEALGYHRVR